MATDARSLELVRLFFELAEQPSVVSIRLVSAAEALSLMEQIGRDPEATELVGGSLSGLPAPP